MPKYSTPAESFNTSVNTKSPIEKVIYKIITYKDRRPDLYIK